MASVYFFNTADKGGVVNFVMLFEIAKEAGSSIDWNATITTIATVFLAGLTAALAWYTARMAKYTAKMASLTHQTILDGQTARRESNDHFEKTRTQDREHHQDSFRPLLVLTPSTATDERTRRSIVQVANRLAAPICVESSIENIGVGPALLIRMHVRPPYPCNEMPFCDLEPIKANGSLKPSGGNFQINAAGTSTLSGQQTRDLPAELWSLVLEYQDVFGNTFHTIHSKDLQQPWTRTGRGPVPPHSLPPPAVIEVVNQGEANPERSGIGE